MDGSATLAMVPSSACMMVAIITTMVISRRRRRTAGSTIATIGSGLGGGRRARRREAERLGEVREQAADRAAVAGIDLDRRAHADAQRRIALAAGHGDAHGDALHDLDPVAGGILRRQHGELRTG